MRRLKNSSTVVSFPVVGVAVDVVAGLPVCHSPRRGDKSTQLQGEAIPLICWSNVDAD